MKPSTFISELSRRKVFRAAILYLGTTWALLQFADIFFPIFDFPDWGMTLVIILSMIGFPIALVGAWAFDFIGNEESPSADGHDAHKISLLRILALLTIIVLSVAVGRLYYIKLAPSAIPTDKHVSGFDTARPEGFTAPADAASIAVLPFVNMSDDLANEYFSDGISEELLNALAHVGQLRVVAHSSSFSFKGSKLGIREIARELNVATILEGSVRKAGNDVRITAQLINASDGYHLWTGTYERELTDIFAVQDEIAQSIVDALRVPLGLENAKKIVRIGTDNIESYNEYLRGLFFSKLFSEQDSAKAILHLKNAVELDPGYAAPYGVLANVYSISGLWNPPEVVMPLSVQAFETALRLDPAQGMALITKGQYMTIAQKDWLQAKEYFIRGLQDESVKTWGSFVYATLHLIPLGDFEQARSVLGEAEAVDPLDSRLKLASASLSLFEQDIPGAIAGYNLAQAIDPNNAQVATGLCTAYAYGRNFSAVNAILAQWQEKLGYTHPWLLSCRAIKEVMLQQMTAALASYTELAAAAQNQRGFKFLVGDIALAVGKIEEAMDWYERSLAGGEIGLLMIRTRFAGQPMVLAHPRLQKILQVMRLDDVSMQEMGYLAKTTQQHRRHKPIINRDGVMR